MSDKGEETEDKSGMSTPASQYSSPMAEPTASGSPVSPSMPGLPPPPRSKTAPPLPPPEGFPSSTNPSSPIGKHNAHVTPDQAPAEDPLALRRTTSAMSSGSSSSRTNREKKRLRFTPVAQENGLELDLLASDLDDAEEGTGRRLVKGKGVARDQADYLKSDPGTPNLSETYVGCFFDANLADGPERIKYAGPCLSQI
jgi:hypothetical protein